MTDCDALDPAQPADSAAVAAVRRWTDSGAIWRVLAHHGDTVLIGLYECTGQDEMDRWESNDPALIRFLGDRRSSED